MKTKTSLQKRLDKSHKVTRLSSYAACALNGMLSSPPIVNRFGVNKKRWASIAFDWAEAMMAEEKKRARKIN